MTPAIISVVHHPESVHITKWLLFLQLLISFLHTILGDIVTRA